MAIYYVDFTGGDDSKDGLSQTISGGTGPWKTINKVNTSTFSAGDQILFKKGEVWREQLTMPSAGGSGNPIIIGAYGSGDNPLILGSTAVSTWTTTTIDPILGDLITESFDATGYDTAGWSESVGSGSVCDEDSTDIADSAGGATQILKVQNVSPNWNSGTRLTLSGDNAISYSQLYIYVAVSGMTNSTSAQIAQARDSTSKTTWTITLYQNSSGVLQFIFGYYTNGASTDDVNPITVTTGQWYKFEVKYDATNSAWEWRVNGTPINSGSLTGTKSAGLKSLTLGSYSTFSKANTIYYDAVKVSSTGYPIAGSTENTWKATYGSAPATIWAVDTDGLPHWGVEKANDAACTSLYDWFYNAGGTTLHINSGGTTAGFDPDTLWTSVEASTREGCVFAQSKANITVQDIHTRFANSNGIYLYRLCDNWTVQRCTSDYNYAQGIAGITGGGTEAPDNVVVDLCTTAYNGNAGIILSDYGVDWTISHNIVHHNGIDSTQNFPGGIKLYGPNGSGGHIVEYNEVYNNGNATDLAGAGGIWFDRLDETPAEPAHTPVICRFNISYNNLISGIFHEKVSRSEVYYNICYGNANGTNTAVCGFRMDAFEAHSASTNHIYNNVIYGNYIGMKFQSDSSAAGQIVNNLVKNNISVGNTLRQFSAIAGGDNEGTYGSGNVYEYNCFGAEAANFVEWGSGVYKSTYDAWETAYGGTTHSIEADPQFTNAAAADFTLQSGSPCINAGVDVGLTEDYAGHAISGLPDIGAYELQGTVATHVLRYRVA